jgi:uncharacterized repeat protein (TIGR01451 family)
MMVRRILFVVLMAVASVLGVLSVGPAWADLDIKASVDKDFPHPGDTVTFTVTFTNPESVDVTFVYMSENLTYDTYTDGTKFTQIGCTGEISWCSGNQLHFTAPIAPGATRTATLTYQIATDSPCGENINLNLWFYSYRESAAGAVVGGGFPPNVVVLC